MLRSITAVVMVICAALALNAVDEGDPSASAWFGFFAGTMLVLAVLKEDEALITVTFTRRDPSSED